MASPQPYHPFDALWEEETIVQRAHGVIWKHLTLLLQQKVASVQAIISPEDGEASFLISMNEGPGRQEENVSLIETNGGHPGSCSLAPATLRKATSSCRRDDTCSYGKGRKETVFIITNHASYMPKASCLR